MTSKEYLGQAYRVDQRINSKIEQVISLRVPGHFSPTVPFGRLRIFDL